ncbi:MAG TPA: hypothetical protein VFA10_17955 [Ktedonobacteraceae bacterium]|nr:hypothetical protein [Ktedonobacteraceae bacterium]
MAKIILTGQHEAIDLKGLRGNQVLMFDQAACEAPTHEDTFWLVGIKNGVLQFMRSLSTREFYPLKPRKQLPAA